jgi:hypothetical protein
MARFPAAALRRVAFRRQRSSGDVAPARVLEPLEGKLFEVVFGDHGLDSMMASRL